MRALATILAAAFIAGTATAQDASLIKGLIHGCMDAQERKLNRPLTNDDKRFILNFCYCRAPGMAALVPDEGSKQKFILRDPEMMAAVQRIDAGCLDGIRAGRRFYP